MCLLLMRMGSAQGNDANVDAETSAEQTINICDFKGGEIDFPHPPSENQGLILEYSVDSRSSCDAFIGNSHNMHYQLEIVSFDENVQRICLGLTKSQRPTLQILQMREVIDVSKDKKTGHRLRNTDLCQLFGLLEKYEKPLPHLFIFNHKKEIHNVLGMRINGRLGGPSFKLRLTRIPTPPKNPIFVTAGSPTRLQCLSACPSDTATLFYVDESGRIRNITDRAMTETIATGQNRPFLENIVIEGEAKGFRRSCSSKLFIAKVFKIQLEDPIAESGTYTFSFGNEEDCTFILNGDNYVDLYGLGKAYASSTWSSDYEAKNAFLVTGDKRERYWSSASRIWPVAIWFQFEQPKRVNKIKFEEHYKLPVGSIYEVFASNKYGECGDIFQHYTLARHEASVFSGGKELQNEKKYYCYGVRAYAYNHVHNVVALKRIQLGIEAPANREISSQLVKLEKTVQLLQSSVNAAAINHLKYVSSIFSRIIKLETAGHITCQMGAQGFANEETHHQQSVIRKIALEGFKEKPTMAVALKDITVTGPRSGLTAYGWPTSATSASIQLSIMTAAEPIDVAITWIACGK